MDGTTSSILAAAVEEAMMAFVKKKEAFCLFVCLQTVRREQTKHPGTDRTQGVGAGSASVDVVSRPFFKKNPSPHT